MSVLIKDMKMPKNCGQCPCRQIFGDKVLCGITGDDIYKLHVCHMVEVKTPHGKLKDADKIERNLEDIDCYGTIDNENDSLISRQEALDLIDIAVTVIEAEE